MGTENSFWGSEWEEMYDGLKQIGVSSGMEKMIKDEGIVVALQVLKQQIPDLFKKVKIEIVSPKKEELLARTPGVFYIDKKQDDGGYDLFVPSIAISETSV